MAVLHFVLWFKSFTLSWGRGSQSFLCETYRLETCPWCGTPYFPGGVTPIKIQRLTMDMGDRNLFVSTEVRRIRRETPSCIRRFLSWSPQKGV